MHLDTSFSQTCSATFYFDQTPGVSSEPPLLRFSVDNIDTVKLLELLGPEKVDPADVKAIKEKLFGYTTFWLTKEEPFGDLGEGVLFIGNLRGKREEIFNDNYVNLLVTSTIFLWWRNPILKGTTPVGDHVSVLVCLGRKFLNLDRLHYGNTSFHYYFSFSLCSPALS
jgi:hypothetical protein